MRRLVISMMALLFVLSAQATLIEFGTDGISTGDNLDNVAVSGTEVAVAEISGLNLTATFGAAGGAVDYLNAVADRLGINSDLANQGTSYCDTGEWLAMSFDKEVNVTLFKFINFTEGDSVKITWNATVLTLVDTDLDASNEYTVDWDVNPTDTIRFDAMGKNEPTSTSGGFGLEKMDMTVIPEPASVSLIGIGGLLALVIRRFQRKHH